MATSWTLDAMDAGCHGRWMLHTSTSSEELRGLGLRAKGCEMYLQRTLCQRPLGSNPRVAAGGSWKVDAMPENQPVSAGVKKAGAVAAPCWSLLLTVPEMD